MSLNGKHATASGRRYRRRVRRLFLLLLFVTTVFAWRYEFVGRFVRSQVNSWLLPRTMAGGRVTLQPLLLMPDSRTNELFEGVQLTVSPAWVKAVLKASPFPALPLPPGLLVDGLMTSGSVAFPQSDASLHKVPVFLCVRDAVALVPHLKARFPVARLNYLLDDAFSEDWTETGEYMLGSYDLEQSIRFDHLTITTVDPDGARPMFPLVLRATATGRLRYRFRDGWFRARVTARVRELSMVFILLPIAHSDGIGFDYRARIEKLDLRVSRMPGWVERRLARAVRRSLERSWNHRRKRERLAHRRLPLWLPMALSVDIEMENPPDPDDVP